MINKQSGFTLLESVTALFILGLLLAISGYGFNQVIPRLRLEGAVQTLVSDLRAARMKAIGRNCYYRIQFFPDQEGYVIERASESGASRWPGQPEGLARQFSNPAGLYYQPRVDLVSSSRDPVFSPRGTAVGTTLVLRHTGLQKVITLSSQGRVKVE
jgi:prepilin-type N-terminal cleavage/methylation domain-containing protein